MKTTYEIESMMRRYFYLICMYTDDLVKLDEMGQPSDCDYAKFRKEQILILRDKLITLGWVLS